MKLSYYCTSPSCGKINYIKVQSDNRYDLKDEIGEEFNERCKHCGHHTKKHINRLYGEMNMTLLLIAFLVAAVLTVIVWYLGYIVGAITFGIPTFFWFDQKKRATDFNKMMID
jgi:Flp pilus assembly protein TadB